MRNIKKGQKSKSIIQKFLPITQKKPFILNLILKDYWDWSGKIQRSIMLVQNAKELGLEGFGDGNAAWSSFYSLLQAEREYDLFPRTSNLSRIGLLGG